MTASLADRMREQAEHCARAGSALTEAVLAGAAGDHEAGGPTAELMTPHEHDRRGTVPSLRLAGSLHRLVLERQAPALAVHYPSVGGTLGEIWPAARAAIAEHLERLRVDLRRPVQTNEVGRGTALLGGLLHVTAATGLPVRLLELGASAGLNLLCDRYAHEIASGVVLGDPGSPVRLHRPWRGSLPPYDVELRLVDRRGCDPNPLDPASTQDRLTLTSFVWADQLERFERLRRALQVAAAAPPSVERLPASAFLERELATPLPGVATVVFHSVVWQYLDREERARISALLAAAGERATAEAPLVRLRLESDQAPDGSFPFRLEQTTWPSGEVRVLADAAGHGPPVSWL